jgi:hypothetical protein
MKPKSPGKSTAPKSGNAKPLPKYYQKLSQQIRFIFQHGLPEERQAVRMFVTHIHQHVRQRRQNEGGAA